MKVWILLALTLFVFSGCSTKTQNKQLRAMNAKQAAIIKQQQVQIAALQSKIRTRELMKRAARMKAKKRRTNTHRNTTLPKAPKRNIVLKKVEDENYSSSYMYPESHKKTSAPKPAPTVPSKTATPQTAHTTSAMTKVECISMIGQAKFDKYTQMFGNEAASLKRCKMLKAMK